MRHPRRWWIAVLAVVSLGVFTGQDTTGVQAAPHRQAAGQTSYRLKETWSDVPWDLTAGRFGEATDISSAPDGTTVVLDGGNAALHVLDDDDIARYVFHVPSAAAGYSPTRVDVGRDGDARVLSTRQSDGSRIERVTASGRLEAGFDRGEIYVDVAVRSNGWIYLVRQEESPQLGEPGVDVFDGSGIYLETIRPEAMDLPLRVDVALDGTVYVLHEVVVPTPPRSRPPGPMPTEEPSDQTKPYQAVEPVSGVLIFTPEHEYIETVPFDFGIDVAVGQAGVFVARYGQVFALRETEPLTPLLGQTWTGAISLDVPDNGLLRASLSHCHFQGWLTFDDPAARPAHPRLSGGLDRPALEGPVYPYRLAAGTSIDVLGGRFEVYGSRTAPTYTTTPVEPQSVQRWSTEGLLTDQLGVCSGTPERSWALDVAADGTDVYETDATCVRLRPGYGFPAWSYCPTGLWGADVASRVAGVAADEGLVALLDNGAGAVVLLDHDGKRVADWSTGDGGPATPPVDIAMAGGRLYLADQGSGIIRVRGLDGSPIADWLALSRPVAVDAGPSGEVFVLARDGWALRFSPDGVPLSAWPLPDRTVTANDIAVDDGGYVYVGFVDIPGAGWGGGAAIEDAGIWVFEPVEVDEPFVPPAGASCDARPDKSAAPARIPLGDEVQVTLDVEGACPDRRAPIKMAIVFDTSRSMNWGYALDTAKVAVLKLLGELDPAATEVALVSFDDDGALIEPLTRDLVTVASRVAGLRANGATIMADGLALARNELNGQSTTPDAAPVILVVSDANPNDDTVAELEAAAADDIELWGLFFEGGQRADYGFVNEFERSGGEALIDPAPSAVSELADRMVRSVPVDGLFEQISVSDVVPANMRYVEGSALPSATWEPSTRTLTWSAADVTAAAGLHLTYSLEPQQVGTWPTNVRATAAYHDALGATGDLTFPVPEVEVYAPTTQSIYMPFGASGHCLRKLLPADVVLVMDTSSSMGEDAVGGGTKLDAARDAARSFVRLLDLPPDRAAVVSFDSAAVRRADLTSDAGVLEDALDALVSTPGTRVDLGLAEARRALEAGARSDALPVVVLLTDGFQNGSPSPVLEEAAALQAAGVEVFAIGLGASVDVDLLRSVAGSDDRLYLSPTEAELASIYARISARLRCAGG